MEPNWAAENLQLIRTLMERSALYRRALAPVSLSTGVIGVAAGIMGKILVDSRHGFVLFWIATGVVAVTVAFLLMRRQALQDKEEFWSPPTRRIIQAITPPFFAGIVLGFWALRAEGIFLNPTMLCALWMILYGCALHSAGFFMLRGIRWLGWIFVICGCGFVALRYGAQADGFVDGGHQLMALFFGGLHLVYGAYLYFTEKRKNAA